MELTTCNILGLDILVTDMKKTINLIEQNIEQLRGQYICVGTMIRSIILYRQVRHLSCRMADHFPVTAGNTDSRMQSV